MPSAFTIDVDNGGTFTDGFFSDGNHLWQVKVDTTPHDLTVCFRACLTAGAEAIGIEPGELLRRANVVRYSTTVGTNSLIQRNGPRLGCLVSRGWEERLLAGGASYLVQPDMLMPVAPDDTDLVRRHAKALLDRGARGIVVCLLGSHKDPAAEQQVKSTLLADYPKHYLGAMPVLLASDMSHCADETVRFNTAVLNAYLHKPMARYLYRAEDDLRAGGFRRPLLIDHVGGGCARVAKTRAIDTYNSGPACGLMGGLATARALGLGPVASFDVGGTSTDVAVISGDACTADERPVIHGLAVDCPALQVNAIGIAGGSIARVTAGRLAVGPSSAGAVPGPACYGLGGTEPTVTDACLTLGIIDPDFFLGGRRRLQAEAARRVVAERLAAPLGIALEEAAWQVLLYVEERIAAAIRDALRGRGLRPADTTLLAYGGAGGLFSGGVLHLLGAARALTFPHGAVFSAYGSSTVDLLHIHRQRGGLDGLLTRAARDVRGEGFDPATASCRIERRADGGWMMLTDLPLRQALASRTELAARLDPDAEVELRVSCPVPHCHFPHLPSAQGEPRPKASRPVYWDAAWQPTPVYEREGLRPGQRVVGPAVVEAADSTCAVRPGTVLSIDAYGNGVMTEVR